MRSSTAMLFRSRLLPMIAVLSTVLPSLAGAHASAAETGTVPLTLQATCDARDETPVLRVRITNSSQQATGVVLGFIAAADEARVVNTAQVISIRPATGADESHMYINPRHALTPPGAPWVVSLAPGESHEVELPVHDFISTMNYMPLAAEVAGGARLQLEAPRAAGQQGPLFTGRLETRIAACVD